MQVSTVLAPQFSAPLWGNQVLWCFLKEGQVSFGTRPKRVRCHPKNGPCLARFLHQEECVPRGQACDCKKGQNAFACTYTDPLLEFDTVDRLLAFILLTTWAQPDFPPTEIRFYTHYCR